MGTPVTSGTYFNVSAPTTATAGASIYVTVTAEGPSGPLTGYTGTVHFTSTDHGKLVALPGNYQFTGSSPTQTFTVTLVTAGNQTVTATDTSNSSITGTSNVVAVSAAATPASLVFGQQPTNVRTGTNIAPAVTVDLLDKYGNVVTSDSSGTVTIALGANPGHATLGGTPSASVFNGVATFGNLTVSAAGNGYTLIAKEGLLSPVTSSSFNVTKTRRLAGSGVRATNAVDQVFSGPLPAIAAGPSNSPADNSDPEGIDPLLADLYFVQA